MSVTANLWHSCLTNAIHKKPFITPNKHHTLSRNTSFTTSPSLSLAWPQPQCRQKPERNLQPATAQPQFKMYSLLSKNFPTTQVDASTFAPSIDLSFAMQLSSARSSAEKIRYLQSCRSLTRENGSKWSVKALNNEYLCACAAPGALSLLSPVVLPEPVLLR